MREQFKLNITVTELWRGCILASIANAIMASHYPEISYEHSWDGFNYNIQDSCGIRGTITFDSNYCIGAFRNDNSYRILNNNKPNDFKYYFDTSKSKIIKLAQSETLQYLLDDVNGVVVPSITTAFWSDQDTLLSLDSLEKMFENGASILKRHMFCFELGVESWKENYDMTQEQISLLKFIYFKKIENPLNFIMLSKSDIDKIGVSEYELLEISKKSFEEINITFALYQTKFK